MTAVRPHVVLDASVALAVVLDEPESQVAREAIGHWTEANARLVVPGHFWLEVLNIVGRVRRGTGAESMEAIHVLDDLGIESVGVDPPMVVLTIGVMERFALTAYDAAYLALAESIDARLATFDGDLLAAAGPHALDPRVPDARARLSEAAAAYGERPHSWPHYQSASAFLARLRSEERDRVRTTRARVP